MHLVKHSVCLLRVCVCVVNHSKSLYIIKLQLFMEAYVRCVITLYVLSLLYFPVRIVHLCRRRSDGAFVILKEIPVEQMSRDERLAAQNECQVLKLLNHPNIIEYYENFLEDKALMIAMEYAPGKLTLCNILLR